MAMSSLAWCEAPSPPVETPQLIYIVTGGGGMLIEIPENDGAEGSADVFSRVGDAGGHRRRLRIRSNNHESQQPCPTPSAGEGEQGPEDQE